MIWVFIICVCIVVFMAGFMFGSISRNKEIDSKDLTIAEYMGENRRLRNHCQALEQQLNLPPVDSHPTDIPFI